jgi:tRNA-binding protein
MLEPAGAIGYRTGMHVTHDKMAPIADTVAFDDLLKIDIRIGTIVAVEPFPEARKPALKLTIDFGAVIGTRRSSAQITEHYTADALIGRQVAAVVNFSPRQIGKFLSEVLTLGFPDENGAVVLVAPDLRLPDGGRLF